MRSLIRRSVYMEIFCSGRKREDGSLLVEGPASAPAPDREAAERFSESLRESGRLEERGHALFSGELRGILSADRIVRIRSSFLLAEAAWQGHRQPLLVLALAGGLSDSDEQVRANCGRGLAGIASAGGRLGAALPALESALGCASEAVRANSAAALMIYHASAGDEDGMERLLNHPKADVRRAAGRILEHISVS